MVCHETTLSLYGRGSEIEREGAYTSPMSRSALGLSMELGRLRCSTTAADIINIQSFHSDTNYIQHRLKCVCIIYGILIIDFPCL